MPKFFVESIVTFREVHMVEAENREIAEQIALNSDYNMSKHVGTQIATVFDYTDQDLERYKREDKYFWMGVKSVDAEGYVGYTHPNGEFYRGETGDKISLENIQKTT
jgi:hypothetical protein